jgi:hypothetical protein
VATHLLNTPLLHARNILLQQLSEKSQQQLLLEKYSSLLAPTAFLCCNKDLQPP